MFILFTKKGYASYSGLLRHIHFFLFFFIKTFCLDLESYSFYIPPLWYFKVALTQLNTKKKQKELKTSL